MNKIEQITIDTLERYIKFYVTFNAQISQDQFTLYIDEACNSDNIHLDDTTKHNLVITSDNATITIDTTDVDNKYSVTIASDIIENLTEHLKYFKVTALDSTSTEENQNYLVAEGIYYNPLVVYEAEIYNINKYCSTCLDDKNMQLIAYVTFKRQLLEDAVILRHYKEAMQLYLELGRILGLNCNHIVTVQDKCTACNSINACPTCTGSSCSIC